jgi:hypothetical protein
VALTKLGQTDAAKAAFDQAAERYSTVAKEWGIPVRAENGPGPVGFRPIGGDAIDLQPNFGGGVLTSRIPIPGVLRPGPAILTGPTAPVLTNPGISVATALTEGPASFTPAVAATASASLDLRDLDFVARKDPTFVSVRWPGAGGGWATTALPNPAETKRQAKSWSLNVASGDEITTLAWKDGVRPDATAVTDGILRKRIESKAIDDLVVKPSDAGEISVYLGHLYSFVIPQALGDCYQQLGNFARAEEYYLQAAAYSFINTALEVPALWIRLANNVMQWGDHLYRQEQDDAAKTVYRKLIKEDGTAPVGASPMYDLPVFGGPVADAGKVMATMNDVAAADVNPGLALPIVTVWSRWQYLLAGLDYYGTSYTPIFTFEYLQQVALSFAQQSIQAEREYVNFQVHAESEAATRRDLQGAVSLADAETAGRREQLKSAQADADGMAAAVALAQLRAADAQEDHDRYEVLGYEQIKYQSIAAAHGAGADWYGDEIRRLARDMEAGSWEGEGGKLAAAATLLAGEKSYEYQLGRMENDIDEMNATIPVAEAQRESARHREAAAALAVEAAQLRADLTRDAMAAFENEVFTPELWTKMAEVMLELSRSFQEWAISSAKLMQRAYNFETDSELAVIKGEYPGSATGGLLGSDDLLRDIESFTYHFVAHQRSKETNVKDVISLANEFPLAFGEFLTSGRMAFETALRDFDVRNPGLFAQRVQAVEVEVVGLLPPEGIRGTLRAGGVSRYRTADDNVRSRIHTVDTMALSTFTVREDAFVYRQDPRIHGLFEGQGVATTWELELPRRANNLDYRLIADVRLVIYYNARFEPKLKAAILAAPALPGELVHSRSLALRYDFPEAWYPFLDSGTMMFQVTPPYLPRNEMNFRTDKVSVRLLLAEGLPDNGIPVSLTVPGAGKVTITTDADGQIATRPGNDLAAVMGGPLLGTWELTVAPSAGSPLLDAAGRLRPDAIEQIAIVTQYAFDWPA